MGTTHRRRSFRWQIAALALGAAAMVALGAMLREGFAAAARGTRAGELAHVLWPEPRALPPFSLTDQAGERFDRGRLLGRWTFMFFGYTACPDVCPTTLAVLGDVARRLDAVSVPAQHVFVSIDPQRDGIEQLADYVRHFHPRFIGVTGPPAAMDGLLRALNVMVVREAAPGTGGTISHTSAIMLVDPRGYVVAAFSPPHAGSAIASQFHLIRQTLLETHR